MKRLSTLSATFLGIGYFPVAPGTLASAVVVLMFRYFLHRLDWWLFLMLFAGLFFFGARVSSLYARKTDQEDPRTVVIDEVAGQLLTLFLLQPQWSLLALGFFLFRFFDIVKPFPVREVERFPGGWGIMADDVVAALYAGILTNVYRLLFA